MKKLLALILLASLALSFVPSAQAGTSTESKPGTYNGNSPLYEVIDFKFHEYKKGIGYGSLPVYSAPSVNAYRCANGKATIDTNAEMFVGGFDETGWLMVRYETNNGAVRVGYVEPGKVRGFKIDIDRLKFSYIPQVAQSRIEVTDDPMMISASFAALDPGETTPANKWKLHDYDDEKGFQRMTVRVVEYQINNDWVKKLRPSVQPEYEYKP